jgi:hypothetical protein
LENLKILSLNFVGLKNDEENKNKKNKNNYNYTKNQKIQKLQ